MNINTLAIILAAACLSSPLSAAYKPAAAAPAQQAADVQTAISLFARMPRELREAYFAEKLGLLLRRDGSSGYRLAPHVHSRENGAKIECALPHDDAMFVGSDGELREFAATVSAHTGGKEAAHAARALQVLYKAEPEVLAAFADEVTQLCTGAARNRLRTLSPRLRGALLAELAGLVRHPNAAQPVQRYEFSLYRIGRTIQRIDHFGAALYYTDSKGNKRDFGAAVQESKQEPPAQNAWETLLLIAQYIGADDVLALCPEELADMRRHAAQR